tara:strand:- start:1550 stop:2467 length:918 start_codon:yes stop_codon:yes gene_type:complete
MKKKLQIDKLKAAKIIEKQIQFCLKIKLSESELHPLRLVQASKSLIGLNLDKPNQKLMNFNSIYLESFKELKNELNINKNLELNPVIDIRDLEIAFLNKDRKKVLDTYYQLRLVSSELHILEFLIEISLKQSGKSFLLIWSLYKSVLFLKNKESINYIIYALDAIMCDQFEEISIQSNNLEFIDILNYDLTCSDLDLLSHLVEAYNANLVRDIKIRFLIQSLINKKFTKLKLNNFNHNSEVANKNLLENGRKDLLSIINSTEILDLTSEFILLVDSIRSLMRYIDKQNHKKICLHLENILEKINV